MKQDQPDRKTQWIMKAITMAIFPPVAFLSLIVLSVGFVAIWFAIPFVTLKYDKDGNISWKYLGKGSNDPESDSE